MRVVDMPANFTGILLQARTSSLLLTNNPRRQNCLNDRVNDGGAVGCDMHAEQRRACMTESTTDPWGCSATSVSLEPISPLNPMLNSLHR